MKFYSLGQNSSSCENVLAKDESFVAFLEGVRESFMSGLSAAAFAEYARH